jgi:hypothetical protein
MTVFVADIASYQHGLNVASLRPDCVGVQIKCTEGASYVNPDYAGWLAQAKAAGLLTVAYHYVNGDDPTAQAANLAAHIGDKSLPVMLDTEKGSGNLPHVLDVCDAMDAAGLRPKLIYLPQFYWSQIGSPDLRAPLASRGLMLVSAHYPSTAPGSPAGLYPGDSSPLWNGYGGAVVSMLQFTDAAVEGGQQVDMNAYRGTAAALAAALGAPVQDAPPPAYSWPQQREWSAGPWAGILQRALMLAGLNPGAVDTMFGPSTLAAVLAFQRAHGLAVDGVVGKYTWAALASRVEAVQRALNRHGAHLAVDGEAGSLTAAAVTDFQRANHLAVDGICGPLTSHALGI